MTTEAAPRRRSTIGRSMVWIAVVAALIAPMLWWARDVRLMQMRADVARQAAMAERARAEAQMNMAGATLSISNAIDAAVDKDRAELERLRDENRDLKKKLAEAEAITKRRP